MSIDPIFWLIAAVGFLVLEGMTFSMVSIWFAAGSAAALPAANQMETMLKVIPSSTRNPTAAMSQKIGSMDIDTPSLAVGKETIRLFSFII